MNRDSGPGILVNLIEQLGQTNVGLFHAFHKTGLRLCHHSCTERYCLSLEQFSNIIKRHRESVNQDLFLMNPQYGNSL